MVELSGEEVEKKIKKKKSEKKVERLQGRLKSHSQKGRYLRKRESGHRDLVLKLGKLRMSTCRK